MSEFKSEQMTDWIEISSIMLRGHIPSGSGIEIFGFGIEPKLFAQIMLNEEDRVDHALIGMAKASGELEVKSLFNQLAKTTQTALFARWANCTTQWKEANHLAYPFDWFPFEQIPRKDLWRAVYLSLIVGAVDVKEIAKTLWGAK